MRVSPAESAVMEALWVKSPLPAEDISAKIAGPNDWTEATVKTFKRTGNQVWLMPHNPAFEPIPGNDAALWRKDEARSTALHARDRSAIYGGFHLYQLKGAA